MRPTGADNSASLGSGLEMWVVRRPAIAVRDLVAAVGSQRFHWATSRNNNHAGSVLSPRAGIGKGTALGAEGAGLRERHDPLNHVAPIGMVIHVRRGKYENHRQPAPWP